MPPLKQDRDEINLLYGTSSRGGSWKQPRTAIPVPTNEASRRIPAYNPFSASRMGNNLRAQAGNIPASLTVVSLTGDSRPAKRQKVGHTFEPATGSKSRRSSGKRPPMPDRDYATEMSLPIVDLTGDDLEDTGELVQRSSDDLNMRPAAGSLSRLTADHKSYFPQSPPSRVLEGENSKWLEEQHRRDAVDVSDPIEEFSDDRPKRAISPHLSSHLQGNVNRKKNAYEERKPPLLDLRDFQPEKRRALTTNPFLPNGVKNKMKPKNPQSRPAPRPAPDINPSLPPASQASSSQRTKLTFLIAKWCLGYKLLEGSYILDWEEDKRTLRIKEVQSSGKEPYEEVYDIEAMTRSGQISDTKENQDYLVLQFSTKPVLENKPGTKHFGIRFPDHFSLGSQEKGHGDVTFLFAPEQRPELARLSEYLRRTMGRNLSFVLHPRGIWEIAEELARRQQQVVQDKRFSHPQTRPASTVDDRPSAFSKRRLSEPVLRDSSPDLPERVIPADPYVAPARTERARSTTAHSDAEMEMSHRGSASRRSARHSEPRTRHASPPVDLDEVILQYPHGAPGAVNITNGDMKRLQPGEFLNDTIIEFDLKVWQKKLEQENPELASQIHVFNSFFYKKMNKKNMEEAYRSVKRWTAKTDLFSKKIIIVPINESLHWYLAIVYLPENILLPPPEIPVRDTRGRARVSSITDVTQAKPPVIKAQAVGPDNQNEDPAITLSSDAQDAEEVDNQLFEFQDATVTAEYRPSDESSEGQERSFNEGLVSSPLTSPPPDDKMDIEPSDDELRLVTGPRRLSPTASDYGDEVSRDVSMEPTSGGSNSGLTTAMDAADLEDPSVEDPLSSSTPVSLFYAQPESGNRKQDEIGKPPTKSTYGKASQKAKGKQTMSGGDVNADISGDVDDSVVAVVDDERPDAPIDFAKTYIFVLDSLGQTHRRVSQVLSTYLRLEAKERKGIENTSKPETRQAQVPTQPNYCDCGLYLLHFARTFAGNHEKYCQLILKSGSKGRQNHDVRVANWNAEHLESSRENLSQLIRELSTEWKAAREEQKKRDEATVVGFSDDDIDIVEATSPVKSKNKPGKKNNNTSRANRLR